MKIAVIGTGIAGNVVAYHLARRHEITVFEADARVGGHTNTVEVEWQGSSYPVDTGFIVFNEWTYPNFIALLDELGVGWQDSDMSFSVQCRHHHLEYNGASLNTLFAQRRNLLRPSFHRMVRDILRFNREATELLRPGAPDCSLEDYLHGKGYSREFRDHYVMPMGAAIWSAKPDGFGRVPARFFVRFFHNHGMLSVNERPTWRVIRGGSARYVEKLVAGHRERIRLSSPVQRIRRCADHVEVRAAHQAPERFDQVFIATHSDQALAMLADPSELERRTLGAIGYQHNEAVLHTDASLMPRRRRAWAAWNYHIPRRRQRRVAVTYNMNILQGLKAPAQFCVTLNHREAIDPDRIIARFDYAHPVFTPEAVAAQRRQRDLNGVNRTYYCGAYWRYGFHEDGVVSALAALEHFTERQEHEQRYFRWAS